MRLLMLLLLAVPCAAEEIPLSEIISTSRQPGLQYALDELQATGKFSDIEAQAFMEPFRTHPSGASDAFLVEAKNFTEAVVATKDITLGSKGVTQPVRHKQPRDHHDQYWCVFYLGTGPSSPKQWIINKTLSENGKVTMQFSTAPPGPATADLHKYWYWVPLGKLKQGECVLELRNSTQNRPKLLRYIELP
jgi:hypothetical protein